MKIRGAKSGGVQPVILGATYLPPFRPHLQRKPMYQIENNRLEKFGNCLICANMCCFVRFRIFSPERWHSRGRRPNSAYSKRNRRSAAGDEKGKSKTSIRLGRKRRLGVLAPELQEYGRKMRIRKEIWLLRIGKTQKTQKRNENFHKIRQNIQNWSGFQPVKRV